MIFFFIYLTSSKILSFEYEKKIYAFLLHFTLLSVSLQRFKCSYHMKRLLILTTLFVLCLCMTAQTPLCVNGNSVTLDIFVDQSSVEVFTQEGTMALTNLVFPSSIYNQLSVEGAAAECQVRQLKRIWK